MMTGKNRRGGLGRGIGALIPTAPAAVAPVSAPPAVGVGAPAEGSSSADDGADASTEARSASAGSGTASGVATTGTDEQATSRETPGPAPRPAPDESADVSRETSTETDSPSGLLPVPGARFLEIPIEQVRANAKQPRAVFDDDALAELTHSVREFGVLQPVVVRPVDGGFELVMGERRLRAATAAGLSAIPAVVRDTADDAMLRDALLENIHRAQLNPLEEAAAYQQLLEEFGVTHEQLATRIGRSRSQVTNTVRLMNLSIPVQRRVAAGVLSAGHARALLGLDSAEAQDELAGKIVAEGLSVRATEELVSLAGQDGAARRRRPVRRFTAPAATELAEKLSDAFDTRVKVDIGRHKGKITVEFATIADLERIIDVMAPGLNPRRPTG